MWAINIDRFKGVDATMLDGSFIRSTYRNINGFYKVLNFYYYENLAVDVSDGIKLDLCLIRPIFYLQDPYPQWQSQDISDGGVFQKFHLPSLP